MTTAPRRIAPGLHFVATPIGSARDITLRALDILGGADLLAAEDTRTARKLLEIHAVALDGRRVLAYHDHNGAEARPRILRALAEGKSVAYVSEAGTPLVADPGYQLGRAAIEEGYPVYAAPGASAVLAALTVSGLASDRFLFAGFPPPQASARRKWLAGLDAAEASVIVYESPRRIYQTLCDLCEIAGEGREIALCRELTKKFEEVLRGPCGQIRDRLASTGIKGEVVLVIDRPRGPAMTLEQAGDLMRDAMASQPIKVAAAEIAQATGLSKRDLYQLGLRLKDGG